jgi:hypothetical protein
MVDLEEIGFVAGTLLLCEGISTSKIARVSEIEEEPL